MISNIDERKICPNLFDNKFRYYTSLFTCLKETFKLSTNKSFNWQSLVSRHSLKLSIDGDNNSNGESKANDLILSNASSCYTRRQPDWKQWRAEGEWPRRSANKLVIKGPSCLIVKDDLFLGLLPPPPKNSPGCDTDFKSSRF